jgi:hypothetical protein
MIIHWRGNAVAPAFQDWLGFEVKLFWLVGLFRYNSQGFETACAVVLVGALGVAVIRLSKSFSPALTLAAALLFAMFLFLPWRVLGSAQADMRLTPYMVALALLAPSLPRPTSGASREIAVASLAFYFVLLSQRTIDFAQVANDQNRQLAALSHIPQGADVTTLANSDCRAGWNLALDGHLGSYVITRRHGFSNDQWLTPGINLLGLRDPIHGGFAEDPSQMVTPGRCPVVRYATRIDPTIVAATRGPSSYLWLIDIRPDDGHVLKGWRQVWRYNDSALYRRTA